MLPPNSPNHHGLEAVMVSQRGKTGPVMAKLEKERPDWVPGLKSEIWKRLEQGRLALEVGAGRYARCYMCMTPELIANLEIEHVYPWSKIRERLLKDANDSVTRAQYPESKLLFVDQADDGWRPTIWAFTAYSNDLDNLVFIHGGGCNQSKGASTPADAAGRNVYSHYGDLKHTFETHGYFKILDRVASSQQPTSDLIAGLKGNGGLWNLIGSMNELFTEQKRTELRFVSEQSGLLQATIPLPNPGERVEQLVWKNPARKADGKAASEPQQAAMTMANAAASVRSRPRSFSDDMMGVSISNTMEAKLQASSSSLKRSSGALMANFKKPKPMPMSAPGGPPSDAVAAPPPGFVAPPPGSPFVTSPPPPAKNE